MTPPTSFSTARQATNLVFGGHIGPQTKQSLEKHRLQIIQGPNARWMLDAIATLPRYWEMAKEKMPEMGAAMDGAQLLSDLESWFRLGLESADSLPIDSEIPDIWTGVLMIVIQLDQYWRYLQWRYDTECDVKDLQAELVKQSQHGKVETVGFCAGMIAAVTVASSHNREDFERCGTAAIRVEMLMAAVVGADEISSKSCGKGGSISLATAWRTSKQGSDLDRIVSSMSPDAYISVHFDESRATVTTKERLVSKLTRQLRAAGVTAIPLAFKGQLHKPGEERERHTNALIEVCHAMPELQFPDAARLALPTYLDHPEGNPMSGDERDLMGMVLRSILASQLNWASTASKLAANAEHLSLVAFGLDRPLPPTILRCCGSRQVHFEDLEDELNKFEASRPTKIAEKAKAIGIPEEDDDDVIAIVGMSLKVAGGDDLQQFEDMLKTGKSQHEQITQERMTHDMLFREDADADPNKKWYGNFMRDSDAFDHKFFKRSPRESTAIDPQGRHSLQTAYQAVEQSGYFNEMTTISGAEQERRKQVGVYVGLCSFEYEINIACHPPTAFTATGGLRSFIPGRLSHYFNWTGPAMTFDTACSSSTVALHSACNALLSGEVTAALCGGVNVLTNLQWTQNLAAGSFISPTGQCKPFDTDADGYCRGDGIAYVFLKKLSTAKAEGNMILGTIRSTGVNQNLNTTPLFVPNVPSLSTLFKDVIRKAHVEPSDISLVECHGTGTPVGDPAEWESVRQAVAGPLRNTIVPVGSVKGHIGHTEGSAGLISLIKVLTMMRGNFIPPQASFNTMNPHLCAQASDNMEVVTSLRLWNGDCKVALINNYGACGSNASVVLAHNKHNPRKPLTDGQQSYLPFWIPGLDARSIAAYSTALASYLSSYAGSKDHLGLADVSFNMKRQSNPGLPQGLIFNCNSLDDLHNKLAQAASATKDTAASMNIVPVKSERPVILCFGGQVSTFVGLDRTVYDSSAILRYHLDECDKAITSQGLNSIYPDIFSCEPVKDVVRLQTTLFAMQYASARSWMDCGLADKVVSVVGHSFGEITALCVAGVLSLQDTIKLIAGRARLVQSEWGPDAGAMMAIEAGEALMHEILQAANLASDGTAGIAAYNGPRSFTVAGSTKAIDSVAEVLAQKSKFVQSIRSKRLSVTNAFHSTLVDGLIDRLGDIGKEVTFDDATIPVERATEHDLSTDQTDWNFVGSHMRQPVYFNHALQRLVQKHPQAIFLEAGSNSTITIMASRALALGTQSNADAFHFQSMSITNTKKGMDNLTNATVDLWKQGLRVNFWPHHQMQINEYAQLLLPPYQFEKSRHWLELKSPKEEVVKAAEKMIASTGNGSSPIRGTPQQQSPKTMDMWTFIGYDDHPTNRHTKLARFRINTSSDKYQALFATHVIAKTAPICPASLEIDMAIETLFNLNPEWRANNFFPVIRDMDSHSAICADSTRDYYIDHEPLNEAKTEWRFNIHSVNYSPAAAKDEKHAEGHVSMRSSSDPAMLQEFARFERMMPYSQCQDVLKLGPTDEGVEALSGRNLYRAFEEVVDFGSVYHGVRYIVGHEGESAGIVHKRNEGATWLDVPRTDSIGQVAGMYVNLLTDIPSSDMFVATGLELSMRSPKVKALAGVSHVLARHVRQSDKAYLTDIFVFDSETRELTDVILGLKYVRIAKKTMSRILAMATKDEDFVRSDATASAQLSKSHKTPALEKPVEARPTPAPERHSSKSSNTKKPSPPKQLDLVKEVTAIVANVSGIEVGEIKLDSELPDLGIDSLMSMELSREVEGVFKCTLDRTELAAAVSLKDLVQCVECALGRCGSRGESTTGAEEKDSDSSDDEDVEGVFSVESLDSGGVTPLEELDIDDEKPVALDSVSSSLAKLSNHVDRGDVEKREAEALRLVALHTEGWDTSELAAASKCSLTVHNAGKGATVIVTGATGSLGSHIVQALAARPEVKTVVCINRPVSNVDALSRQEDALSSRNIELSPEAKAKLKVYDTDTSKPHLGLAADEYEWLVQHGGHIIHNAWPMSGTRPLKAFEPQLTVMRNLLDLARHMAIIGGRTRKVGFQFVSSIGVVGFSDQSRVLEGPVPMSAVIPSGYNEAKWACERLLSETLGRYPSLFRAAAIRSGQISGSTTTGFWNSVEHFVFIVKSAQALGVWPDLRGELHWLPVDRSAGTMIDLLGLNSDDDEDREVSLVYHVDNPIGQSWQEMSKTLTSALGIPKENIIPFKDWIERVKKSTLSPEENPAIKVMGFLEEHFERMACGEIVLDTSKAKEVSETLKRQGIVGEDIVRNYVEDWKRREVLK